MARVKINVAGVVDSGSSITSAKNFVGNVKYSFNSTRSNIDGRVLGRNNIGGRMSNLSTQLGNIETKISIIKNTIENGANSYQTTDNYVIQMRKNVINSKPTSAYVGAGVGVMTAVSSTKVEKNSKKKKAKKIDWWTSKDTWKTVANFGIVGSAISLVGSALTGATPHKNSTEALKYVLKGVEKIAKAIPKSGESFDWKTLLGFTKTTSNYTKFWDRFGENIDKLKIGNAKTVTDKIAVGAKWAGYGLTVLTTAYDNFYADEENNSTVRKTFETVGESAVKIGEGIVIGAAVAAAFTGAPAVVVGAVTVGVCWAIDKGFEAITGKNTAEFVSDLALDTGEKIVKGVGKAAKAVTGTVSGWWKKAFG